MKQEPWLETSGFTLYVSGWHTLHAPDIFESSSRTYPCGHTLPPSTSWMETTFDFITSPVCVSTLCMKMFGWVWIRTTLLSRLIWAKVGTRWGLSYFRTARAPWPGGLLLLTSSASSMTMMMLLCFILQWLWTSVDQVIVVVVVGGGGGGGGAGGVIIIITTTTSISTISITLKIIESRQWWQNNWKIASKHPIPNFDCARAWTKVCRAQSFQIGSKRHHWCCQLGTGFITSWQVSVFPPSKATSECLCTMTLSSRSRASCPGTLVTGSALYKNSSFKQRISKNFTRAARATKK